MYKITLTGLTFYGYHGASKAEKELGQRFVIDLEIESDLEEAANSDNLEHTINYVEIFELVKEIVESGSKNLLETLANSIAIKILSRFDVESISVKISKPAPPVPNVNFSSFGVEVFKQKT